MAKIENVEKWGRKTARERYADGGGIDTTAPNDNPSGPFGQASQDRREWDTMKARQPAQQTTPSIQPLGSNPHGSIDAQGKVHGMKRGGRTK